MSGVVVVKMVLTKASSTPATSANVVVGGAAT